MVHRIWGKYQGRTEKIDEFTSKKEAERCLGEYQMAYGVNWKLWLGKKSEEPQ